MLIRRYIIIVLLMLGPWYLLSCQAQKAMVRAFFDTNHVAIGDQLNLVFRVENYKGQRVKFPELKDTLNAEVEILAQSPTDTVISGDGFALEKKYLITSFTDSVYMLPEYLIQVEDNGYKVSQMKLIVSLPYFDSTMQATMDTTHLIPLQANVDNYAEPLTFKEIWDIIKRPLLLFGSIFLVLAIIAAIIIILIVRSSNGKSLIPKKPMAPPHIIALGDLKKLKEKQLWQQDLHKEYYSELTHVVKLYMERRYNIPAVEYTTNQLLGYFKSKRILNKELFDKMSAILSYADMSKFAKATPLANENELCLTNAFDFVEQTKQVQNSFDTELLNPLDSVKKEEQINSTETEKIGTEL